MLSQSFTVFLLCALCIAARDDKSIEAVARARSSAGEVQDLLKVPRSGDGIIAAVRLAVPLRAYVNTVEPDRKAWLPVADAILVGCVPEEFRHKLLAEVNVSNLYLRRQGEGKYGGRFALRSGILTTLKRCAELASAAGDASQATRFARAAIVFSINDPENLGFYAAFVGGDTAKPLLGAEDETMHKLRMIGKRVEYKPADTESLEPAVNALTEMISSRDTATLNRTFPALRDAIIDGWGVAGEQDVLRWQYANFLWRYACLSKARGATGWQSEVESLIKQLKSTTKDTIYHRWLDEAVNLDGPEPTKPGYRIVRDPNAVKPKQ